MKQSFFVLLLLLAGACASPSPAQHHTSAFDPAAVLEQLTDQAHQALAHYPLDTADGFPRSLEADGSVRGVRSRDWTSGFYPGVLWMLYDYSGNQQLKQAAQAWTAGLEQEKWNGRTHDMGFKIYCSFGQGYRLTDDPHYRDVIVQGARTLMTRFRPTVGALRSWDHHQDEWAFPVIIDNMMNLELLFAATRLTGDSSFYSVARQHALTTLHNHYRPDASSFHVVSYDTLTGQPLAHQTHQGYADESAWARGQAWGLYGFTMTYRETREAQFLEHAHRIADYLLQRLPTDGIPPWDFDVPEATEAPRDASAAAIMASALLELSTLGGKRADTYRTTADRLLTTLASDRYRTTSVETPFLLRHSTGHVPHGDEIDVPISYADYYFVEALLRRQHLQDPS
ncbi:Glycosyl Hydrolase Family 88 [Catalinimonas alkaloidigena]|uniref:Glycosyl Hydrolase Family 88 n=1 Tax=Catalinimonas alkaloidigena TaxID=1075417 RepID=A0A1G9HI38_9BACT|nr:glycoside hydrolase family 88 protein [Catalinimonas alkaloidigena]SDL12416.1 Glycosyl Hydrolase Family 88 [Catalinimonas alkaloidigena]